MKTNHPIQTAKYVILQCFRCDDRRRVKLSEIGWAVLQDVRCLRCGCTGTTHIVRVDYEPVSG